jgi:NADPH:quinone reductase-like Zn-dependent oxidoreductase
VAQERFVYFKPSNFSFEQAAAIPVAGNTALQAVRKGGKVQRGQRILIVGASGGVGHLMVQIAKADGAHVTAVCGAKSMDMVKELGADEVIDYATTDYTKTGQTYDVILDAASTKSLFHVKRAVRPGGRYLHVGGDTLMHTMLWGPILSLFTRKTFRLFLVRPCQQDLIDLKVLAEEGKLKPVIEKVYPFTELPVALKHVESRRAKGKNVVTILA